MIFVCVGSRNYPFDRLFRKLDELVENGLISDEIFAQTGASNYKPKHFASVEYLEQDAFIARIEEADMVISHAATGSFMQALKRNKKVIGAARMAKYGEHVDDHQIQTNEVFAEHNYILAVYEMDSLLEAIQAFQNGTAEMVKWENKNPNTIIELIDHYIESHFPKIPSGYKRWLRKSHREQ